MEVAGKTEIAGKTQVAGKTEVVGKTQIAGKTESSTGLTVRSVDVHSINEYLHWQWQKAMRLGGTGDLSASLAEINSAWVPNSVISNHFSVRFSAPEIKAPCPHEVIILFHIEDVDNDLEDGYEERQQALWQELIKPFTLQGELFEAKKKAHEAKLAAKQ